MASFGYGAGDIVALTKLAWDVVQNSRKACGEYDELTQDITSFHTVLKRVEYETSNPECPILTVPDRRLELQDILLPCQTVLNILNQIMQKYNALSLDERGKGVLAGICQSVCFGNDEMQDLAMLRAKMTARMLALSVFLNTLAMGSLGRIERKMNGDLKYIKLAVNEEIARLMAAPESIREGSILTCYQDDDKEVWKEFRRSLIKQGFNSKVLEKNKETIVDYITELGKSDIFDDDNFGEFSSITTNPGNEMSEFGDGISADSIHQDRSKMTSKLPGTMERTTRRKRADGYRQCGSDVMGQWALGTHRRFRVSEFRYEVLFVTPVIFVAPPTNRRGPIPGQPIQYIDGTLQSHKDTWLMENLQLQLQTLENTKRVTTADDERASWVIMLSILQDLESKSRGWESKNSQTRRGIKYREPEYTMIVSLQRKTRSWDFMPPTVFKPFATTTICHMVEMVTMLGMHWKMFDQRTWQIRAEGNGLILTSTLVDGLGIMVSFSQTGIAQFEKDRIIPSNDVKRIAFGSVPSIFRDNPSLEYLNFGGEYEVNGTLELLGCTTNTILKYTKKHSHLFSVTFELVGMLAAPVRLRGSNFRMLPNPTIDHFFPTSFSRCKLMTEFHEKLTEYLTHLRSTTNFSLSTNSDLTSIEPVDPNTFQLMEIAEQWKDLQQFWPTQYKDSSDAEIDIDLRESIHDALDKSTNFLLSQPLDSVLSVVSSHTTAVIDSLNNIDTALQGLSGRNSGENKLISIYFDEIRETAVNKSRKASDNFNNINPGEGDSDGDAKEEEEDAAMTAQRNAIWCTLVFRMTCWLLLHDFNKADVKVVPSDLLGSRIPVFIA